MSTKSKTVEALALDGMTLDDFNATVFVVVGGEILADSETAESAAALVKQARSYGEDAFAFAWDGVS